MTAANVGRVNQIVDHALEDLATWTPPRPLESLGPSFPEICDGFLVKVSDLRRDMVATLITYPLQSLEMDYPAVANPKRNPFFDIHGRHAGLAKRLKQLKDAIPQDFLGGWAIDGKATDLPHWRGFQSYSLAEATLLSVGRDPRLTSFDYLFTTYGRYDEADEMLYWLEDRHDAMANGLGLDPDDSTQRVDVDRFFAWVEASGFRIDLRFRRMLKERQKRAGGSKSELKITPKQVERPLHKSSWNLHARIITAMAITKYGLENDGKIARVAKAIQNDAACEGLGFDLKPLRLLLRAGLEMWRGQNTEP